MTIKPFEAAEKRKNKQKQDENMLSRIVENNVTEHNSNYMGEWWIEWWIDCSGFSRSVINDIVEEYKKAGWDVRIESYDGVCIVIRERCINHVTYY